MKFTSKLIKRAWAIRKTAAAEFNCKVAEISWGECLKMAKEEFMGNEFSQSETKLIEECKTKKWNRKIYKDSIYLDGEKRTLAAREIDVLEIVFFGKKEKEEGAKKAKKMLEEKMQGIIEKAHSEVPASKPRTRTDYISHLIESAQTDIYIKLGYISDSMTQKDADKARWEAQGAREYFNLCKENKSGGIDRRTVRIENLD